MELETRITQDGLSVRAWAEPHEAAMFVVALVTARGGILEAPKAAEAPRPPQPPQLVEVTSLASGPAEHSYGRPTRKVDVAPGAITFRCPQRIRDMCEEYGLDTAIFNQAHKSNMGAGESYLFADLHSGDAVTLYEMFNSIIAQGGGKKVPGVYEIRRKLQVILDEHFDHAQRKGIIP